MRNYKDCLSQSFSIKLFGLYKNLNFFHIHFSYNSLKENAQLEVEKNEETTIIRVTEKGVYMAVGTTENKQDRKGMGEDLTGETRPSDVIAEAEPVNQPVTFQELLQLFVDASNVISATSTRSNI